MTMLNLSAHLPTHAKIEFVQSGASMWLDFYDNHSEVLPELRLFLPEGTAATHGELIARMFRSAVISAAFANLPTEEHEPLVAP